MSPEPQHKVLVVDDEPALARALAINLRAHGWEVVTAADGRSALDAAATTQPDVIVLDLGLPDMDGTEVIAGLRGWTSVPIVVLSARQHGEDKIEALDLGADDYVTKPFALEELLARLRALLRRTSNGGNETLRFADLELDEDAHEVTRAGAPVELTATEYRLLRYFMLNPRRVLTRPQLLEHVWEYDFGGDARVLETYVSYLRKKLDVHGPPLIHTVRGVGFRLETGI